MTRDFRGRMSRDPVIWIYMVIRLWLSVFINLVESSNKEVLYFHSDRFDCHYVMATFVNVYLFSFIRTPSVQNLLNQALKLPLSEQVNICIFW